MDNLEQAKTLFLEALEQQNKGQWEKAETLYRKALVLVPQRASVINNLSAVLLQRGRYPEAKALCEQVLSHDKSDFVALLNLGICESELKSPRRALEIFDVVLAHRPDYVEALTSRSKVLLVLNRPADALADCDRALAIDPRHVQALNNRGAALLSLKKVEESLDMFDAVLAVAPQNAEARYNRGAALRALRKYEEEVDNCEELLRMHPDYAYAAGKLANAKAYCCDWANYAEDIDRLRSAVRGGRKAGSPFELITALDSVADVLQGTRTYVEDRLPPACPPPHTGERRPHGKIRLAYLSADFGEHAVAQLATGLFEHHDRQRFETTALSLRSHPPGEMRSRLECAFDTFIEAETMPDYEVARWMLEHEIDIAIDLMGFTQNARMGIFALRPAPVQAFIPFYPGTLATACIDYIIADRRVLPDQHQPYYAEKAVYLPDTFLPCGAHATSSAPAPTRAEAGLPQHGFVFCSFNNSYKITPQIFDVWMRLLQQVDGSVIWLLEEYPVAARNLRRAAAVRGVAPSRVVFAHRARLADHIARHRLADLFLDTLPVNAGATAIDAFSAGLPVLTCAGQTFVSRVASSLLGAIGLPELITQSIEDYEALALKLATSRGMLATIREKLLHNRETCPLFDIERYCRHLEKAYETMWRRRLNNEAPSSFAVAPLH